MIAQGQERRFTNLPPGNGTKHEGHHATSSDFDFDFEGLTIHAVSERE